MVVVVVCVTLLVRVTLCHAASRLQLCLADAAVPLQPLVHGQGAPRGG